MVVIDILNEDEVFEQYINREMTMGQALECIYSLFQLMVRTHGMTSLSTADSRIWKISWQGYWEIYRIRRLSPTSEEET